MIKINSFWQKYVPTRGLYGSPPSLTSLDPDMRVRREGYGGPNLDEKNFQLFFIFIVSAWWKYCPSIIIRCAAALSFVPRSGCLLF